MVIDDFSSSSASEFDSQISLLQVNNNYSHGKQQQTLNFEIAPP